MMVTALTSTMMAYEDDNNDNDVMKMPATTMRMPVMTILSRILIRIYARL